MSLECDLRVRRGSFALDLAFSVPAGGTAALVGPNGGGKTTVLQAVAGLAPIDGGHIHIDGRVVERRGEPDQADVRVAAPDRHAGYLLQDPLLFPHLPVIDNVAFGPRARGAAAREARDVAAGWLERLDLVSLAGRIPAELSGGQAQRVALARAFAAEPHVLLLDEPMANLDPGARVDARRAIRASLQGFGGACVVVTHDPIDVLALSDQVLVVEDGMLTQSGPPGEITRHPRTAFAARLGGLNLLRGRATDHGLRLASGLVLTAAEPAAPRGITVGEIAFGAVRPQSVALFRVRPDGTPRNVWEATVAGVDLEGDRARVELAGPISVVAEITAPALIDLDLVAGSAVWAAVKATDVAVYAA